jgi:phage replication initiation protein
LKTTIDWLRFRVQEGPEKALEALRPLFGLHSDQVSLKRDQRAKDGFQEAAILQVGDLVCGRVDWGGASQRGWARWNITGTGCDWVSDWDALAEVEALPGAEIRRVDIALTTWSGEVTHDQVVGAHTAGLFRNGGRPPDLSTIVSSNERAGRTCYVGKREADKFFRGYEKGFELVGKLGPAGAGITHIDGHPIEDIYRCEVELKAKGTVVPWEVVERRDQYFGGCYPFLADLLPGVEADILMRRPERAPQTELAAALANCRIQYGATLYTALRAYGGDIGAVWEKIVGHQHSAALLGAGVLMVDHE